MNFKGDRAIYLQIADYIMDQVLAGHWREEDRIPSLRDLAVSIEVNPNTVVHAYNFLQEQGVIFNQRGVGYFVARDAVAMIRKLGRDDFFQELLPQVFKRMLLLEIPMSDVEAEFEKYRRNSGAKQ